MSKSSVRESKTSGSTSKGKSSASQVIANASNKSPANSQPHQQSSFISHPGSGNSSSGSVKSGITADPRMAEWKNFFLDSGIPEHAATEYANIFVKERINWPILRSLDKGYLADMGINCVGDQISILQAAKKYSGEQYAAGQNKPPAPLLSYGVLRMDEEPPMNPLSKLGPIIRETEKVDISNSGVPASKRIGSRNDVTSSTAVRSVIKNTKNPSDTVIMIRSKRPADDDNDADKERYIVKKLSALPPRQVRQPSPMDDVSFTVRMGAGVVTKKKDVFSRLTPKGVKSSTNTNLVRVLESKMSRLSTTSVTPAISNEVKPTLVSDFVDMPTPVFNRLGSAVRSSKPELTRPAPVTRNNSGSTVFSRLGVQEGQRSVTSFRAAARNIDARNRLSVKDRLG